MTYRKPEGAIEFMNIYTETRVKKAAEDVNNAKQGIDRLEAICEAASFTRDFPTSFQG